MASLSINGTVNQWQYKVMDTINGWFDQARNRAVNHPDNFEGGERTAPFRAGGLLWDVTVTLKRVPETDVEAGEADVALGGTGRGGISLESLLVDRQNRWTAHAAIKAAMQLIIDDLQSTAEEVAEAESKRTASLSHQLILETQITRIQARLALTDNEVVED